jgi:hypothetical protein
MPRDTRDRDSGNGSEEPDLSDEEIALAEQVILSMSPEEFLHYQWASADGETELAQSTIDAAARMRKPRRPRRRKTPASP